MKTIHVCSLLLIPLMSCRLALSQSAPGTMVGTARDASGAVLPKVGIRVTNEQTNQSMSVTTDSLGNYTVPLLKPGVYSVAAELSGFRRFLAGGIVLQVEQTASRTNRARGYLDGVGRPVASGGSHRFVWH